jgi:hypothetical protein
MNEQGGNYTLFTFNGPANLCELNSPEVWAQIPDLTLQSDPLDLLPPSFNIKVARTDYTTLHMDIDTKILLGAVLIKIFRK